MSSVHPRTSHLVSAAMLIAAIAALALPGLAGPPGENGPIVFVGSGGDLASVGADGSAGPIIAVGTFSEPDVSPDGTAVLAIQDPGDDLTGAVVSIDIASGDVTTVVESGATSAAWSGDGASVAYATTSALFVIDGEEDARMVSTNVNHVWDWSPIDDRILVTRSVPGEFPSVSLETVDAGTGASVVIDSNEAGSFTWYPTGADFSPDGADIVYAYNTPGYSAALIDGGVPFAETSAMGAPSGPVAWSPDGSAIAYRLSDVAGEMIVIRTVVSGDEAPFENDASSMDWAPEPAATEESEFDDVPADHVFADDIAWLAEKGITKGCNPPANTAFCPEDFVTRGQMAAFLVRAFGYTDAGGGDLFEDDDASVFESDIDRMATAGVTKGCNPPDNTLFCPENFVTRGQMAAFLVRAFAYSDDGGGDLFVDDDDSIFESDIDRLATAGVTRGCNPPGNTEFCPNDFVTRGQMAAFLHRAFGD